MKQLKAAIQMKIALQLLVMWKVIQIRQSLSTIGDSDTSELIHHLETEQNALRVKVQLLDHENSLMKVERAIATEVSLKKLRMMN